jgi:RNA binding exosome subunit
MDFPFRSATITVFAHATEDEEKVRGVLRALLPKDMEIERRGAKGHHGNPILIFSARIRRRSDLRRFWREFMGGLGAGEKQKLSSAAMDRLGEDCCLYLRFDKQLASGGELMLTDSGDALHVRLKVAAYPAKQEIAAELVREFVASGLGAEPRMSSGAGGPK